jgi:hypothetical protein
MKEEQTMRRTVKIVIGISALVLSVGAFAYYHSNYIADHFGHRIAFHHAMDQMGMDQMGMGQMGHTAQNQTIPGWMTQMDSPQAMEQWMNKMFQDPQAMQQWMQKMSTYAASHGSQANNQMNFSCHGYWNNSPLNTTVKQNTGQMGHTRQNQTMPGWMTQMDSPQAMEQWMNKMFQDPQAMQQWMQKMSAYTANHGSQTNNQMNFSCHSYWNNSPLNTAIKQ